MGYFVKIINPLGQEVYNQPINQQEFIINLSSLGESGTYFIQIQNRFNQVIEQRKIILQ